MNKSKKKFLLSLVTLLTTIVLVACAGTSEETSQTTPDKLEQIKEAGVLNIGTSPDYPPMEFYILDENGDRQIAGSDIELAKAIADEIGVELKITATDFNGVIANIQTGSVDFGISGFTYTEDREEVMQFSTGYAQESDSGFQGILMSKDLAGEFDSLDEIKEAELTFGAQGGSIQYELSTHLTDEANIKQYGTLDVSLTALNSGDIDGVVVLSSSVEPMLTTFPNLIVLPQENFDLDPERLYEQVMIGFPKGEEYASLIEVANKVIDQSDENGDLEKWKQEAIELSTQAIDEDELEDE